MNSREAAQMVLDNINAMVVDNGIMDKIHFKLHMAQANAIIEMGEMCPVLLTAFTVIMLEKLVADEKAVAEILKNAASH